MDLNLLTPANFYVSESNFARGAYVRLTVTVTADWDYSIHHSVSVRLASELARDEEIRAGIIQKCMVQLLDHLRELNNEQEEEEEYDLSTATP